MQLNRVVLPAPFGPIRPRIWPSSISKETPSSAMIPPNRRAISRTSRSRFTSLCQASCGNARALLLPVSSATIIAGNLTASPFRVKRRAPEAVLHDNCDIHTPNIANRRWSDPPRAPWAGVRRRASGMFYTAITRILGFRFAADAAIGNKGLNLILWRWLSPILSLHRPGGWVYSHSIGKAGGEDGQYQRQCRSPPGRRDRDRHRRQPTGQCAQA